VTDGAVGTAEVAAGDTERRDLDGALGSDVARAVVVDLDEFEVVEDPTVRSSAAVAAPAWNVKKVRSPWVMGSTLTTTRRNSLASVVATARSTGAARRRREWLPDHAVG
jgi:hypothetical protein